MFNLENLRHKTDFYQTNDPPWVQKIWRTLPSLDWFIKDNRSALNKAGAIVRIGRDYFIDAVVFPDVAQQILAARANVRANASAHLND